MKEIVNVRQVPGDKKRRWFYSNNFDLFVWLNDDETFAGFELCYDKQNLERSIVWRPQGGFVHAAIDAGEARPGKHKAAPILVADGSFEAGKVYSTFASEAVSLPNDITHYVLAALERHPNYARAG